MKQPKASRYAVGSAPATRRVVEPSPPTRSDQAPLRRRQALLRLGSPLAQVVRQPVAGRHRRLPRWALVLGGLGTAAVLAGAGLLASAPLLAAAVGCGAALLWSLRRKPPMGDPAALGPPALPPAAWQALDLLLEQVAAEAPEPLLQQLIRVKQVLLRVTRAAAGIGVDAHFTLDDHFHLQECVRRYLPDALEHFARVPRDQRGLALRGAPGGGEEAGEPDSAHAALARQLSLIEAGLQEREQRCARSAGQALLAHERFLQDKNG